MLERDRTYNDILDRVERLEMRIEDLRDVARPQEVILIEGEAPNWQTVAGWVSTGTVLQDVNGRIVLDPTIPRILIDADGYIESADFVAGTSGFRIDGGTAEFNDIVVRGTIYAEAGEISGVLTIGAAGGIYQGTGTFAVPTTGLKIWNDGGIGRLATYNAGVAQVYFGTDGKLYAGAGDVALSGSGIVLTAGSTETCAIKWYSGASPIFKLYGYTSSGNWWFWMNNPDSLPAADKAMVVYIRANGFAWAFTGLTITSNTNAQSGGIAIQVDSALKMGVEITGATFYDEASWWSGGNKYASISELGAASFALDVSPDSDGRGLFARQINRLGISTYDLHFRSGAVAPAGYAWQGAPFGGTPATLDYAYVNEYLAFAPVASTRYFLSRAVTNAGANWQLKSLYGRFNGRVNGRCGLRFDDGTDNNYVQVYVTGEANNGTMTVTYQYRAGGGGVTTTTSAINVPASESIVLRLYMYYSAPNYTAYAYIIGEDGQSVSMFSSAVAWAPAAGRAGVFGENPSVSAANRVECDWLKNEFV